MAYLGCTFMGNIDRIVIAKRDTVQDVCFNVVLDYPSGGTNPTGLALPPSFGLESASVGPGYPCPTRNPSGQRALTVTGSVTIADTLPGSSFPAHVNADLTLSFGPNDAGVPATEMIVSTGVDVQPTTCP